MKTKLFFIFSFLSSFSFSQNCNSCTWNLTGPNNANTYNVNVGQKLCIASGTRVSGSILVYGGEVCNSGIIDSAGIQVYSGTLNNYGNIAVGGINSTGATVFNNYGDVQFTGGIILAGGSAFTNQGNLLIKEGGFSITGPSSTGSNMGYMHINYGGFAVYSGADFYTACVITIDSGSFTNYGNVTGPVSGCGGFKLMTKDSSAASNYGNYGLTGNLDMCDPTGVNGQFTTNSGNVGSNVTYCQCTNNCVMVSGIRPESAFDQSVYLYPNPAAMSDRVQLVVENAGDESYSLRIHNLLGQLMLESTIEKGMLINNSFSIPLTDFSTSMYLVSLRQGNFIWQGKLLVKE